MLRRNSFITPEIKLIKTNRELSTDKANLSQSVNANIQNPFMASQSTSLNTFKEKQSSKELSLKNSINTNLNMNNIPVSIFKSPNSHLHMPIKLDYYSLSSPKGIINSNLFKNDINYFPTNGKNKKIPKNK